MAKTQQAIFSFSAGVLSPRISSRADTEKFSQALQIGQNFIVTPQGGAIYRQGFEYLSQVNNGRMFQFHQGGNESDILIFVEDNGDIEFYGDGTQTFNPLIDVHSYTDLDLEELQFVNQERYGVLTHPGFPPRYLEIVDGQFTTEELSASNVPDYDFKDANSPASAVNLSDTYTLTWSSTWTGTDKKWFLSYDGARMTSPSEREYSTDPTGMEGKLNTALASIAALNQSPETTYATTWVSALVMTINISGPGSGKELEVERTRVDPDTYVEVTRAEIPGGSFEKAWSYPTYVFHVANYYQCIKPHSAETGVNEPPDAEFWIDLGTTKPDTFDWQYYDNETQTSENVWLDGETYSPGGRGFPRVPCFHEQRLILGGTPAATTALWGSRIADYKDFKPGPEADDPFAFTLDTSDTPAIKWMRSQIRLMIGTSAGDWRVGGEITISPTDVQAFKQNNARSYNTGAIAVDVNIFYIEQGNTKIRTTRFSDDVKSFTSIDASITAEHLFHQGVKRIVLMQNPEVLIMVLRLDGTLAMMTYDPANGLNAWTELTSDGFIHDIAAYYSTVTNQDELYVQIAYDYDPEPPQNNTWQIERMPYPSRTFTPYGLTPPPFPFFTETLTTQGVICMDSWERGQMANNVITGLHFANGSIVGVLIDDAWTGTYEVTDGTVTLEDVQISPTEPYEGEYAVGLMYDGNLKTFEVATGNNYQRGTGLGTVRRWAKLYVRTLDSALPIINGFLPPDRKPEFAMNVADILNMGIHENVMRGGEWGDGSITIQQNRPYPTQIIGLYGSFQLGND
jgi:hypothetical protein